MTQPEVPAAVRYGLKPTLRLTPSGYLLDAATAESYTLNGTGQYIVRAIHEGCEFGALWTKLVAAFEVPELKARRDVRAFLRQLLQLRLLVEDARPR